MKRITLLLLLTGITTFCFSQWQSNFGIGVEMPKYRLDVDGDINISNGHNFLINGNPIKLDSNLWQKKGENIFFNSGNIGIGTDIPSDKLTIEGNTSGGVGRTFLKLKNNSIDSHSSVHLLLNAGINDSFTALSHHSDTYTQTPTENYRETGVLWNHGQGLALRASGTGLIRFETNVDMATKERMRINDVGNVGINTTEPKEKLEVNGNILISNNNALILTSPNGTKYNITVDDSGNLTTSISTGNKSVAIETEVIIFPNPTNDQLTVRIIDQSFQNVYAEIYSVTGKMILLKNYETNTFNINTADLKAGNYILKLRTENGNLIKTEKFIKK